MRTSLCAASLLLLATPAWSQDLGDTNFRATLEYSVVYDENNSPSQGMKTVLGSFGADFGQFVMQLDFGNVAYGSIGFGDNTYATLHAGYQISDALLVGAFYGEDRGGLTADVYGLEAKYLVPTQLPITLEAFAGQRGSRGLSTVDVSGLTVSTEFANGIGANLGYVEYDQIGVASIGADYTYKGFTVALGGYRYVDYSRDLISLGVSYSFGGKKTWGARSYSEFQPNE